MKYLDIDASRGEGGGQLTRLAVALAAIAGRAVHLKDIRAGRAKPGLMPQHLAALRAVAALSGGELAGAALGAPPGGQPARPHRHVADRAVPAGALPGGVARRARAGGRGA